MATRAGIRLMAALRSVPLLQSFPDDILAELRETADLMVFAPDEAVRSLPANVAGSELYCLAERSDRRGHAFRVRRESDDLA